MPETLVEYFKRVYTIENREKLAQFLAFETWDIYTLQSVVLFYEHEESDEKKLREWAKNKLIKDYEDFPSLFEDEWDCCFGEEFWEAS